MIGKLRYFISKIFPNRLRFYLAVQFLPRLVDNTAKLLQGMDSVWEQDQKFLDVYKTVSKQIRLDKKRAYVLYRCVQNCNSTPGQLAELGVYMGGSARITLEASDKKREIWLFDTFEGLPATDPSRDPYWKEGDMGEAVKNNIFKTLSEKNFKLVKGWFPKSAEDLPQDIRFAFVHIDGDIYQSTIDACEFFYPRMTNGGIMLFDDYTFLSTPGVKKAVDLFFKDKKETPIFLGTGQGIVYKQVT